MTTRSVRSVIDEIIPAATEDDAVEIEKPRPNRREPARNVKRIPEGHWTEGGWNRMPYYLVDLHLMALMKSATVKAYVACARLADAAGHFHVGHAWLARAIGVQDVRHVEDAMRQLMDAGLITRLVKGTSMTSASFYHMVSLARVDYEKAKGVLSRPLNQYRDAAQLRVPRTPSAEPTTGPRDPATTGPTDPTTKTRTKRAHVATKRATGAGSSWLTTSRPGT